MTSGSRRELASAARAWPFEEARKLLARIEKRRAAGVTVNEVLFETGYGPSGLPHIGTFGEVARTSWVRQAFETMSDVPTRLVAFSDDMDGLRKVPDNVPNQDMLREYLGKPLTAIPDPFGTHPSFGAHNNARLKAFLDRFGFRYEFFSSTGMLQERHVRSGASDRAAPLRKGARRRAADAGSRSGARPTARSSPFARERGACCRCPWWRGMRRPALLFTKTKARAPKCRSPAGTASCNGRPIGPCAGSRSASITKCRARTSSLRRAVDENRARPGRRTARNAHLRIVPGRSRDRRFRNRRATGFRSTNGWPMARRRAWRSSCSRSRARPSGFISTRSRGRWTIISPFSRNIIAGERARGGAGKPCLVRPCGRAAQ